MAVSVAVPYGKYMLDRKLTEGGMAEIYLARPNPALAPPRIAAHPSPIIVKRLFAHHSSEAEFVRMFMNEAKLATKLKHPNIVDIFDQGESDGTYYLAMEFIHGEDLRGIAQQADAVHKRPPMAIVVRIIIDTLAGLHYAHTLPDDDGHPLGLVHRDVSPQNVLVTYEGVTKIIDFGIAKATRSRDMDQTQAGMIKGKYAYMSPEQTRSDQLDARSDVFSVGTLLWELLTWRRLFRRATDLATLVAVTEEPAPPAATVNPEVPQGLDDILMRALSMDREQRWDSAKAFHDALVEYVDREGWDASVGALGRYMKEIFADKLSRERREREREAAFAASMAASASVPNAVEDRLSSGMPMRNMSGRVPGPPPPPPGQSAEGGPRRAMTMPLQVISASQIQQRKAMVVPKSGNRDTSQTGIPPVPPNANEPASRSSMPSRMSRPPPPPPPSPRGSGSGLNAPPSATSMPMRIIPDGASSFAGANEGPSESASAAAGHSGAAIAPVPSVPIMPPAPPIDPALSSGLGLPRLDQPVPPAIRPAAIAAANLQPMQGMSPIGMASQSAAVIPPVGHASQSMANSPTRANRASVIIAIVLGVLIGVIAVLLMQLLVLSR